MRRSTNAATLLAIAMALPAAAQTPSDLYVARGAAPDWTLSIGRATILYKPAGARPTQLNKPRPIIGFNGERYVTPHLIVDITHAPCSTGGATYRDSVVVTQGRRTVRGCGGDPVSSPAPTPAPGPVSVIDGDWIIERIAGRPPIDGDAARITLRGGRLGGSTGCNMVSGDFRVERGRLIAPALATTRRACPGPAMEQERTLLALLGARPSVSRNRAGKLVMTGARGATVVLAPAR